MSVILACAWQPRGELPRLQRYWSRLQDLYAGMAVAVRRDADPAAVAWLRDNGAVVVEYDAWSGRHAVLHAALAQTGEYIHYCDMDRMIRWVETRPDELAAVVQQVQTVDCLIGGRTPEAYATHPAALIETEKLPNAFFSHWFGHAGPGVMDVCAGSKGFSRSAAQFVLAHSTDTDALRMDAEWPVLLKRAGFTWAYVEADGLDWESADQHHDRAADRERQQAYADAYDAQVDSWKLRVQVAQKIMDSGLAAINLPLPGREDNQT